MRHLFRLFSLLFCLVSTFSCATPSAKQSGKLSLSDVEKIDINAAHMDQISQKWGQPDIKTDLEGGQEAWLYMDGSKNATRLSFIFVRESGLLKTINWFVRASDPESQLATAMNRYPHVQFDARSAEWTNPHAGPDEVYYMSPKQHVELIFQKSSKKVSSIRWDVSNDKNKRLPTSQFDL